MSEVRMKTRALINQETASPQLSHVTVVLEPVTADPPVSPVLTGPPEN